MSVMLFGVKLIIFIAARRERSCFSLVAFVLSGAAAPCREDRRALGEEGIDALFEIRPQESPIQRTAMSSAMAQKLIERLSRWQRKA